MSSQLFASVARPPLREWETPPVPGIAQQSMGLGFEARLPSLPRVGACARVGAEWSSHLETAAADLKSEQGSATARAAWKVKARHDNDPKARLRLLLMNATAVHALSMSTCCRARGPPRPRIASGRDRHRVACSEAILSHALSLGEGQQR